MNLIGWVVLLASIGHVVYTSRTERKRSKTNCSIPTRLQDKWHFLDHKKTVLRVKSRHFVFREGASKPVKYKCVKSKGNIYLLRKRGYRKTNSGKGDSAVLCLVLRYIADHPKAEYALFRLMGPGEKNHVMSPVVVPNTQKVSFQYACDLEGRYQENEEPEFETRAFLRRALPGCKFPKQFQGRWNYTYQHAKSLEIWSRNSTLHLMNGRSVKFHCDRKDGGIYIFRALGFVDANTDAFMCVELVPVDEDDPFYKFQFSRHNSGNLLDNQLRPIAKSQAAFVHIDCDWIGSPARPEYLYP